MAFAHDLYGGPAAPQPSPASAALGVANAGAEVRTPTGGPRGAVLNNPTFALVGLLALAALVLQFSVRFEVSG